MRRISYRPYLFLLLFYLCLFNAPSHMTEGLRSVAVCSFSPGWRMLDTLKTKMLSFGTSPKEHAHVERELENMRQENLLLHAQLEQVRQWLLAEDRVQEQYERLKLLGNAQELDSSWKDFFKRRFVELQERLDLQGKSLSARVIFREPSSWSSALWIDVGERQNIKLGKKIVVKNSPVLVGTSILGVVEYVGESRSRVRLITDARLVPSVRAVRGAEQNRFLREHLEAALFALEHREELFASAQESHVVVSILSELVSKLRGQMHDAYLAKGEIFGSSAPLWRARSPVLKGIGFNYDFADEEGPARDLRTGEPYDAQWKKDPLSLLRPGDMLVTTGLDGVFPAGYRVASVSKVHLLKEGASSYEIEAVSTLGDLDAISNVTVLPALSLQDGDKNAISP